MDEIEITTLQEKPKLKQDLLRINNAAWPEFMFHWECPAWENLFSTFANFQILLQKNNKLIAFGHTVPAH
ncbi:MAG: hypothetical protein KGY74_06595 [Candidatus Cloacimonetes bacterium]|nr:hypothetical protein [Candidatus Cloacimonadota bacterium]